MDNLQIPYNKTKVAYQVLPISIFALVFQLLWWIGPFVNSFANYHGWLWPGLTIARIISILGIPLFGFGVVISIIILTTKKPAISINNQSISFNSIYAGTKTINWENISGFELISTPVFSPFRYATTGKSGFKSIKGNITVLLKGLDRTKASISVALINYDVNTLLAYLNQMLAYKNSAQPVYQVDQTNAPTTQYPPS